MNRSSPTDRLGLASDRGTATLETALVSSLLLTLALGVVEFGNAHSVSHTLTSLSREGANMAARGETLDEAVAIVLHNGASIDLAGRGGAVASRVVMEGSTPRVKGQSASAGYAGKSQLGVPNDAITGFDDWGLADGQTIYVVELFYPYAPVTPFGALVGFTVPEVLYERAIF